MKLLTHYLHTRQQHGPKVINWRENSINDSLFYSCRSTHYNTATYPSQLHYHDYYELVLFEEGDIRYICESQSYRPRYGDMILIPPKTMHMSMLDAEETRYRRHVFYLYPDALEPLNAQALTAFLSRPGPPHYFTTLDSASRDALFTLLPRLDEALRKKELPEEMALSQGLLLQIFYLLNQAALHPSPQEEYLPQNVKDIQAYLDQHFAEITSVAQVAAHFFYSREYISRLFQQYLHTTVGDYLIKRRIAHSQSLIAEGVPLLDACFQSGFKNVSTFIRAFRTVARMTPSQYRAMLHAGEK